MTIPKDAMSMENYKRWERGLPLREEPQPKFEPPEPPVVANEVKFEAIPNQPIRDFDARRHSVKNEAGVIFCGYNFRVEFEGGKVVEGFLFEGAFAKLKDRSPKDRIDLLNKIRW
jgi:hypothetical protein